ncbi:MAG: RHS repeat-associated core domain-containing protein [Dehalococcoidia bacterium]|nr:RHS repeat-associated core domain-containing protein [Dehalococcoidia bacterium]
MTDTYSYDVFGAVRSHGGSSTNYWQFAGEQTDSPSGLQYLRARYYDPATGRFMTRDPLPGSLLSTQTQNRYAYVENNPVNRVDPTGLDSEGPPTLLTANPDISEFIRRVTLCPEAAEFFVVGAAALIAGGVYQQPVLAVAGFLTIMIGLLEYQQECLPPDGSGP